MNKKKIFIASAIWGEAYTSTFVHFNLATQLSKGNIPSLLSFCEVTYHIITTAEDKLWMEAQPSIKKLATFCHIEWEFIGDNYGLQGVPKSISGDKYVLLRILQNTAMKRAVHFDIIMFNYADFIWADGSIQNVIRQFDKNIDAVFSFCLPVDHNKGIKALELFIEQSSNESGVIDIPARVATSLALNALHKEAKLRFWDNEVFTTYPTYILWPVQQEGVVITAYHQTILALRVDATDPIYHNGVISSTLDGFYSAVLAENNKIVHANNSDDIFVFSLYETIADSSIRDASTREDMLRYCLKSAITEKQRAFALDAIEVRTSYTNDAEWDRVKKVAYKTLENIHVNAAFDPNLYYTVACTDVSNFFDASLYGNCLNKKLSMIRSVENAQIYFIETFLSKNLSMNGNFDQWNTLSLKYSGGAWVNLPAKYWLGHFDGGAEGVFAQSTQVPNMASSYSLVISGAVRGTSAYVAQKISASGMLGILKTDRLSCSGYIRYEGSVSKTVLLCMITPNKRNDYTTYHVERLIPTITMKKPNVWQYFKLECSKIASNRNARHGAMFYFLLHGLDTPENKVYFSQVKFESGETTPFKPRSVQQELFLRWRLRAFDCIQRIGGYIKTDILRINVFKMPPETELFAFLEQNRMSELVDFFQGRSITIDGQTVVDKKTAAYFQLCSLPEKFVNKINATHALNRILLNCEQKLLELILNTPAYIEGYRILARNLWMQGRYEEALSQFQLAEARRIEFAALNHLDPSIAVILPTRFVCVVGLMGYLDALIKRKILANDQRPYHLAVSTRAVVNKVFFDYWKPYLNFNFPLVKRAGIDTVRTAYTVDWDWVIPNETQYINVNVAAASIQCQWRQEDRSPLLKLNADHTQLLNEFKSAIGMIEDDWYVCLDVYSKDGGDVVEACTIARYVKSTPTEDYYLAIQAVIEKGGWVVTMGDTKILHSELQANHIDCSRVVDYASSSKRSEVLDVALAASCELFISSNAYLHVIAQAFGRRVCHVNCSMYIGFPSYPGEIFIPMLYYSVSKHRFLSMQEILSSDLIYKNFQHLIANEEIVLLRNTPDEIVQTVIEALQGDEYVLPNIQYGKKSRQHFEDLNQIHERFILGRIGLYFCEKYSQKLFQYQKSLNRLVEA